MHLSQWLYHRALNFSQTPDSVITKGGVEIHSTSLDVLHELNVLVLVCLDTEAIDV